MKMLPEDGGWLLVGFTCFLWTTAAIVCNWLTIINRQPIATPIFKGIGLFPGLLIIETFILFVVSLYGLFREASLLGMIIFMGSAANLVLVSFSYPIFLYHK